LTQAGDALLYRPGRPVRLLHMGVWRETGKGALEPAAFLLLCGTFFEAGPSSGMETARSTVIHEDRRELLVTRLPAPHDALLVRASSAARGGPPILTGDEAALAEVLDLPAGLVLVGAPGIRTAEELLRAVLSRVLERRSASIVLTAERERGRSTRRPVRSCSPRARLTETLDTFTPTSPHSTWRMPTPASRPCTGCRS